MRIRRYADVPGFIASLRLHHSVGAHAAILLVAATVGGLLVSRLLLWAGLEMPVVRFPIAVVAAYGLFLLFVDWWIAYIGLHRAEGPSDPGVYPDGGDGHAASLDGANAKFEGAGGTFDGGGASAAWDGAASAKGELAVRGKGAAAYSAVESKVHAGASAAEAAASGGAVGEVASGGLAALAEFALPLAIIVAVGAALIVASGWLVGFTPLLLVETAAEVAIASGLIRSMARKRSGEWLSSLFLRTVWRAAALAVIAAGIGLGVSVVDPSAKTIGQAVSHLVGR